MAGIGVLIAIPLLTILLAVLISDMHAANDALSEKLNRMIFAAVNLGR